MTLFHVLWFPLSLYLRWDRVRAYPKTPVDTVCAK